MLKWLKNYIASPTHKWWVDNVWRPSWTRFVTLVYGIPAALLAGFTQIGDWAGNSTIKGYVSELHVPEWVPQALVIIALIHFVAHGREDN